MDGVSPASRARGLASLPSTRVPGTAGGNRRPGSIHLTVAPRHQTREGAPQRNGVGPMSLRGSDSIGCRQLLNAMVLLSAGLSAGAMCGEGLSSAGAGSQSDAAVIGRWCRATDFEAIEAEFTATRWRGNLPVGETRGFWRLRLRPFFGERVVFTRWKDGALVEEQWLSYDEASGEGRRYQRSPESILGRGMRSAVRPKELGLCELPSDSGLLSIGSRPIPAFFGSSDSELASWEARALAGEELQLTLHLPDTSTLLVYLLGRRAAQPLEEFRVYRLSPLSHGTRVNAEIGPPIELLAPFRGAILFLRRMVKESTRVGTFRIPIEWELRHCLWEPGESALVRLHPGSIRLPDGRLFPDVGIQWPEGTRVFDSAHMETYWVGTSGERLDGEAMSERTLDRILDLAGLPGRGASSEDGGVFIKSSCGANALYIALALRRHAKGLRWIVRELGAASGSGWDSLDDIVRVARKAETEAMAAEGSARLLRQARETPLIIHATKTVRWESVGEQKLGHFIVVDDHDPDSDTVRVFDPPNLPARATVEAVTAAWTGRAVVLDGKIIEAIRREASAARLFRAILLVAGPVLVLALMASRTSWFRRAPRVCCLAFLASLGIAGCGESSQAGQSALISVVGASTFDLGRIAADAPPPRHEFLLRNTAPRAVAIATVRKTCGCLRATVSPWEIPAFGQATVGVELDTVGLAGPKTSRVILEFDEAAARPIEFVLKAFVVREYAVMLDPAIWAVQIDGSRPLSVTRRVRATEFSSGGPEEVEGPDAPTCVVRSLSPHVRVLEVGAWRKRGWTISGLAREAQILFEVSIPEGSGPKDERVLIEFRRPGSDLDAGGGGEGETARCTVLLRTV